MMSGESDDDYDAYFRRMFPRAVAVARRVTVDDARAKDAAQIAFERAYSRWPRVRLLEWRDAWVLRVTINEAIRQTRPLPLAPPIQPASDETDLVDLRHSLVEALQRLPRRQREAVTLRYLTDLSEIEVANVLEISRGSVKTHLHRGLAALRGDAFGLVTREVLDANPL